MTVIRPNSVSGINSITAQADEIKVFKSNGTQGGLIIGGANLNATTGISTILALNVTGNVSIAGTLTYQDVTNVDSIGIITARAGVNVSAGQLDVGSNIKLGNAGVITATSFSGSGANLTSLPAQATIANNADNRIITGGSGVNLNAEANVLYDGTNFGIGKSPSRTLDVQGKIRSSDSVCFGDNSSTPSEGAAIHRPAASTLAFVTNNAERLRIDSSGYLSFAGDTDTYIHHPSANQLAITRAGGSAPIMRWGTGGNGVTVGINTDGNLVTGGEILSVRGYTSIKSYNYNYAALYTHNESENGSSICSHILFNVSGANRGGFGYDTDNSTLIFNNQNSISLRTGATGLNGTERLRITSSGTAVFGGNAAAPIVDNGELYYRGNSTSTFQNLPQNFYLYSDDKAYNATNPGAGMLFGGQYTSGGQYTTFAGIHGIKENNTDNNYNSALVFGTRQQGSNTWERLRIASNGFVTNTYKPVKTAQNTALTDTTGVRFVITLPNTSRMFRITGSFNFTGSGSGRIWGDFGDWSDSHSPNLEGFANWWVNGASGDLEQDNVSSRYFEVADPFDYYNLEVTYDVLITTKAFNNGQGGHNSGGGRPGISGNISWTYSTIGRAWTVFSYQDTNATGTDRLNTFAWDIDGVSGSPGTGYHHYVIEEYPLT